MHPLALLHQGPFTTNIVCGYQVDGDMMQAAALKLAYMEYADLAVGERLALLQGLLEMALEVETIREFVSAKVEAMAPLSKREGREEVWPHSICAG